MILPIYEWYLMIGLCLGLATGAALTASDKLPIVTVITSFCIVRLIVSYRRANKMHRAATLRRDAP